MSSPKRRKSYLYEEGNVSYRARYDVLKKIASTDGGISETAQSNECHEDDTTNVTISLLGDMVSFDNIRSADDVGSSLYETNPEDRELDESQACGSGSNHLENLIQSPGFCDMITTPAQISPAELLLIVLKYSLRNNLPLTSTENLLRLLNSIFAAPVIPESRYMIDKLFNPKNDTEFHATCSDCTKYIGKFGMLDASVECRNCQATIDVSNPSSGNYFAIVNPSDAISEYLQAHEDYYNFVMRERNYEKGHVKDVYDGKCYRDFVKHLPESDRFQYVTATFNTDGAPVFESSTYSIWPIYLMINELPVEDRLKNLIVCGLWFGKSKPVMSVFLDPFVEKINELSSVGINCKIKGETLNVKLYALICCVDTIARSPMNGTMQFNAFYGCDWCLHRGEWFEGCLRYPVLESVSESRDMKNTIELMKEAVSKGLPVFGIKNASPLINLLFFNIISGFVPDYMHCLLAGVVKQLTEYLIKLLSVNDLKIIELRLSKIRAPNQLGRLSRPLKDRAMWKAREWENWLLYYSIPVLDSMIDKKLLKHWGLLVESLYTLLKTDITCGELDEADRKLHEFVCGVELLYSKAAMTYNVHQLLHIAKSVYDWGPLWAHSTFAFESGNHELLTAIQCAKGVNQQILRYLNMQRSVAILEKHLHPYSSDTVNQYCSDLNKPRTKKCVQLSGITYFGTAKMIDKQLLETFVLSLDAKAFVRIVKNGCLYASSAKQNLRSCNYFAQLINKTFVNINTFLVDEGRDRQIAICNIVETTASEFSSSIQKIRRIDDEVFAVNTTDIDRVCIFLDVTNTRYISAVPNLLKY